MPGRNGLKAKSSFSTVLLLNNLLLTSGKRRVAVIQTSDCMITGAKIAAGVPGVLR